VQKNLKRIEDYALVSLINAESTNQKTMINKQIMKSAVVQIGFAVISIGMMFVVLGFSGGGLDVQAKSEGITFDVKTGSTGLAVVVIGAVMVTLGGVLKNDYSTVELPGFLGADSRDIKFIESAFKACEKAGNESAACFWSFANRTFSERDKK
jgi:hypothetical protein